jgi:hypothetical protein
LNSTRPEGSGENVNGLPSVGYNFMVDGTNAGNNVNFPGYNPYQGVSLINAVNNDAIQELSVAKGTPPAIVGNAVTAAFFAMNGTQLIGMGETDAARHATALEVLKLVASAKGANLNLLVRRATTELTPLMIAADAGAADAVQVLLDAGANPNTMNGGKYTALDYAVDRQPRWSENPTSNRAIIVRALLAKGARKDRKPADGVTPTERAKRAGNPEVIALLR